MRHATAAPKPPNPFVQTVLLVNYFHSFAAPPPMLCLYTALETTSRFTIPRPHLIRRSPEALKRRLVEQWSRHGERVEMALPEEV